MEIVPERFCSRSKRVVIRKPLMTKNVHSPFALTKHRKACQRRIKGSTPPGMKPDHADDAEGAEAVERAEESDLAEPGVARIHQPLVGVPFSPNNSGRPVPDGQAPESASARSCMASILPGRLR